MPARKKPANATPPVLDYEPPPPASRGFIHAVIHSEWGCMMIVGGMALVMLVATTMRSRTFWTYALGWIGGVLIVGGIGRIVGRVIR
jgi:hypothetical protein